MSDARAFMAVSAWPGEARPGPLFRYVGRPDLIETIRKGERVKQQSVKRPPSGATLVRRAVRDSARAPAAVAVDRVRVERHRVRGLHACEAFYGAVVVGWVAGGWAPTPAVEEEGDVA